VLAWLGLRQEQDILSSLTAAAGRSEGRNGMPCLRLAVYLDINGWRRGDDIPVFCCPPDCLVFALVIDLQDCAKVLAVSGSKVT
jgi:hypothetical protein